MNTTERQNEIEEMNEELEEKNEDNNKEFMVKDEKSGSTISSEIIQINSMQCVFKHCNMI